MEKITFEDLGLSKPFLDAVSEMGFTEPSEIQIESIRLTHSAKDIIGQSQTGTGKTAAFGLAGLENIDESDKTLQMLVLCPTRELAIQITNEFAKLLKYKQNIKTLAVYGGQDIRKQITALKSGVQVVVGTPGRIMDHMRRRTLKMESVKILVLDEADEMLDMGFLPDIETILEKMPSERRTMLYSATLSNAIMKLAHKYTGEHEIIRVAKKALTVANIEELYFDIKERSKFEALCRIIDRDAPELAIVFCNTKRRVDAITEQLVKSGYQAEGLHGDLVQSQRDKVMQGFRHGKTAILVATDVAARGIDVENIDFVVNYDIPQNEEYYVHRIGRTGRAGKSGVAYTFVVGKEIYHLKTIEKYKKSPIAKAELPSLRDVNKIRSVSFLEKIHEAAREINTEIYSDLLEELFAKEDLSTEQITAVLLKAALKGDGISLEAKKVDIDFSPQRFSEMGGRNVKNQRGGASGGARTPRGGANAGKFDPSQGEKLHLDLGGKMGIRPGDIVGAITGEAGVTKNSIGDIEIFDNFSYVTVEKTQAGNIMEALNTSNIKGKRVNVKPAGNDGGGAGGGQRFKRSGGRR